MESANNLHKIMDEQFIVLKQFANFGEGTKLNCILYDDYMEFKAPGKNGPLAKLYYRHIKEVLYGTRSQVVQADKSVVARAIVGQIINGYTGAMIGGMSAMQGGGKKSKQVTIYYLIIGYNGKDGKEKMIPLAAKNNRIGQKYAQFLLGKTGLTPESTTELC